MIHIEDNRVEIKCLSTPLLEVLYKLDPIATELSCIEFDLSKLISALVGKYDWDTTATLIEHACENVKKGDFRAKTDN